MNSTERDGQLQRLTAFSDNPAGGNPAGVWIGERLPTPAEMQSIAHNVGYSETAFLAPDKDAGWTVRYFSPEAEVPFCGHATIASGVALGDIHGPGLFTFETLAGRVDVDVSTSGNSSVATLTSVEPKQKTLPDDLLSETMGSIRWTDDALDPDIPAGLSYAGAWHVILATSDPQVLTELDYDFDRLKTAMLKHDITTIQLVHRTDETTFSSRNPFPVGGVVEDPATGAAAAALGAYLRHHNLIALPTDITINQGIDMGRPSLLKAHVPLQGGIKVSGTAVPIPE